MQEGYKNIMLVDDDELNNILNRQFLTFTMPKAHVTSFQDAQRVIYLLQTGRVAIPDIILLDINMPELDGWEFIEQLHEMGCKSKVMMLSSSVHLLDLEKARNYHNVVGYIEKPLTDDKIEAYLIRKEEAFGSLDQSF